MRPRSSLLFVGAIAAASAHSIEARAQTPPGDDATVLTTTPEQAKAEAAWAQRERQLDEGSTITGATGLLHLQHAAVGAPGQVRFGFGLEWFSAGFLCTPGQSCANPRGGTAVTNDTLSHTGATLSVSATLAKIGAGALDLYASTSAQADSDSANVPGLLQTLGDSTLGLGYNAPVSDVFSLGGAAQLAIYDGEASVGPDFGATTLSLGFLGTADLRRASSKIPLRLSANAFYTLDNSADTVSTIEAGGTPINRIERYSLGIERVDHVDLRVGGEGFLADGRFRPFLEYDVAVPYNRQGYACSVKNASNDGCIAINAVVPSTLAIGGRVLPWKHGFSVLAALDIGVTGTSNFVQEVTPVAPWMLHVGIGWAFDTQDRPDSVRIHHITHEQRVEVVKAPIAGHLKGLVHERDRPIAGAILAYEAHPELSPLATDSRGKFGDDVPPGDYKLDVTADGYKPGTCSVKVPKTGGDVAVDCALEAAPKVGSLTLTVHDADSSAPLSGVTVSVVDKAKKTWTATTDATGAAKLDGLAAGGSELTIVTDGYLALVSHAEIELRGAGRADLALHHTPKDSSIDLGQRSIGLKHTLEFSDANALLPDSTGELTELADALIRNPAIRRIEIQGHTDDGGAQAQLIAQSQARADAVREWLTQHGVSGERVSAHGYGSQRPMVPNVTTYNRSRNRRIQVEIERN